MKMDFNKVVKKENKTEIQPWTLIGNSAKNASNTKFTPSEWIQNQIQLINKANLIAQNSLQLRIDNECIIRESKEKVQEGQREAGRKLGERITEIGFWKKEIVSELDRLLNEDKKMHQCFRNLEKTILDFEKPLQINRECFCQRESRKGTELVNDDAEHALMKEIRTIWNCKQKLEEFTEKCQNQLRNVRVCRNQLQIDTKNKESALGIDKMCHEMNSFSKGLQYFEDIEKFKRNLVDLDAWAKYTEDLLKKSQTERSRSCQLRKKIEAVITTVSQEVKDAWENSNKAFTARITEMINAKSKTQIHLSKIQEEVLNIEKDMERIKKAITDKNAALKLAQTRLEARTHRPQTEFCGDNAYLRLIEEVETIVALVTEMQMKLEQNEVQHRQLLITRNNLEDDLKAKVDALLIDREKCMGLRKTYPIPATIVY